MPRGPDAIATLIKMRLAAAVFDHGGRGRLMASGRDKALSMAMKFGQADGAHHKAWVIDQMVRALTGDGYDKWVASFRRGESGPNTYVWELGVEP